MLVQGTPMMPSAVQDGERTPVSRAQATEVVHSIKGYLAHCQDQLPDLELQSGGWTTGDARFAPMASLWKQHTQEMRRFIDEDAAKNEPHRGEPGQGDFGSHPRLTPYETEKLLEALLEDTTEWNLDENDDDE